MQITIQITHHHEITQDRRRGEFAIGQQLLFPLGRTRIRIQRPYVSEFIAGQHVLPVHRQIIVGRNLVFPENISTTLTQRYYFSLITARIQGTVIYSRVTIYVTHTLKIRASAGNGYDFLPLQHTGIQ